MSRIIIIVPAYNESANIVAVIEQLSQQPGKWDIVVINDCSEDNTAKLVVETKKAYLVNLPVNLGIGGAVQSGFKYAACYNYDKAVQFDGDGQHLSTEIPKLLNPIIKGQADVVIGSRFLQEHKGWKTTPLRRAGIKIFELVNLILVNERITDNTSGFRAYNRRAIEFLARHYPLDYPEPEAVILLGRNDFKITEVFVEMQERGGGSSSISGLQSVYYMIKVLLAISMNAIRPKVVKAD